MRGKDLLKDILFEEIESVDGIDEVCETYSFSNISTKFSFDYLSSDIYRGIINQLFDWFLKSRKIRAVGLVYNRDTSTLIITQI